MFSGQSLDRKSAALFQEGFSLRNVIIFILVLVIGIQFWYLNRYSTILRPSDFFELGQLRFERFLTDKGVEIDRKLWRCGFESSEKEYDPYEYAIVYCGAEKGSTQYFLGIAFSPWGGVSYFSTDILEKGS